MDSEKAKRIIYTSADKTAGALGVTVLLVLRVIATVLLIAITTGLLFACIFAYYVKTNLTTNIDVTLSDFSLSLSSSIAYEDESGNWRELTTLSGTENRIWITYDGIPKDMEHAAVAIEDKRFYEHKGVDWYRTVAAFANMFLTMKNDFGGSTITQQLIKNLTKEDDVTVQRKLMEIFQALDLEKRYTKDEIIEWYLNVVYFGEGCNGIYTAAEKYFGKEPGELSLAECTSIIGITNNPSRYDPFISTANNKQRQETILREMYDQEYISYEEYTEAVAEELVFTRSEHEEYVQEIYTYYEEAVINDVLSDLVAIKGVNMETARALLYSGGYKIYSCIDPNIQAQVDAVYQNTENLPQPYYKSNQQLQSSIVVMDPYTGNILALEGGVGEKTINFGLNRATQTQRPPGSSIKPIAVYGPAFEYGLITQSTLVNDAPYPEVKLSGTTWLPRNSGGGYRHIITIRQALTSSINTVSAQVLDKLTPAVSYEFLQTRLGVTSLIEADRDYAPLSLGQLTNGITVREMCQAYCAFVNEGTFTYARTYTRVEDAAGNIVLENEPKTITALKPDTAHSITNMLQNALAYGTGGDAYFTGMSIAGKTGTTSDNKDRWFVGYSPYYVAAVWTGYDQPEAMYYYINPAAKIWKTVMQPVHEGLENKNFPTAPWGRATNIFGDLTEALEEQEEAKKAAAEAEKKAAEEAARAAEEAAKAAEEAAQGNSGGGTTTPTTPPATGGEGNSGGNNSGEQEPAEPEEDELPWIP